MRLTGLLAALPLIFPAVAGADASSRVVGGHDASPGVYDAVANVEVNGAFGCTGTLISASWVLSAGHCGSVTGSLTDGALGTPIGYGGGSIAVTLGTTKADGTGGDRISVDRVVLPPDYLFTSGFDISLLHLQTAARQTPVRIAGTGAEPLWKPGALETIAGFGLTSQNASSAPATMQEAQVPVVPDADCAAAYSSFESTTQLCAGYPQGGTDTCSGDSGGPLFGHDAKHVLKLVGATSYGSGCGQPGKYGVYARVADATLREWIRSQVPDAVDDHVVVGSATAPGGTAPFTAAAAVAAVTRRTAARRGVRVRLRCSAACRTTVRVTVDNATRKRLGLRRRTIYLGNLSLSKAMRRTRIVRIKRAVAGDRKARIALAVTVDPLGAGKTRTVRRSVRLTGRA